MSRQRGTLVLNNPTAAPSIAITGHALPVKGDIITLRLWSSLVPVNYRVLRINGTVAQLMAMRPIKTSLVYNSSSIRQYEDSDLDEELTTYYNSLLPQAKRAIIAGTTASTLAVYKYSRNSSTHTDTHASTAVYPGSVNESLTGRYIYALDVADIEQYFDGTASTPGTYGGEDLTTFFGTTGISDTGGIWLRSLLASDTEVRAWAFLYSSTTPADSFIERFPLANTYSVRPTFYIDLSCIGWDAAE